MLHFESLSPIFSFAGNRTGIVCLILDIVAVFLSFFLCCYDEETNPKNVLRVCRNLSFLNPHLYPTTKNKNQNSAVVSALLSPRKQKRYKYKSERSQNGELSAPQIELAVDIQQSVLLSIIE